MQFAIKSKKNPFQRAKELEEQRKKRDDEEAAKVYEDFVKEFANDDNDEPSSKAFVRGGTIKPGSSAPPTSDAPAPASAPRARGKYVPSFLPPPSTSAAVSGAGTDKVAGGEGMDSSVFSLPSKPGKARAMDAMLEKFKRDQEERELRKGQGLPALPPEAGGRPSDAANADLSTTNLYIGNLAPDVDEHVLMKEFGRFGPIGSVKIMWPRDEEQRRRGRNNGFVAFMRRDDAERAKEALDGIMLRDLMLSIGWGKPVALPAMPCYPPPGGLAADLQGAAVPPPSTAAATRFRRDDIATAPAPAKEVVGIGPDIPIVIPLDPRQRFVIDAVAFYVMRDGCEFEQVVMEREQANPEFNFLFDVRMAEHAYYRWRLYSLACGDSLRSWRVDPFLMVEHSNRWVPPPMTVGVTGHKTRAQQGRSKGETDVPLSDLQRDKFEDMLRTLSVEREDICSAMVFAFDNAESAAEVTEVLSDALTLAETPIPLKVARLFLVSDILHNSTAPVRNASRYRARLEDILPDVFESLAETARGTDSRMSQELLRKHVLKVLRVWRGWYIFSDDFLNGLQATFLRTPDAASPDKFELPAELAALGDEELETKCRRSGLSRKGGRDAQMSRLLALDAYLNGDTRQIGRVDSTPRPLANPTSAWEAVPAADNAAAIQPPLSKWEAAEAADAAAAVPAGKARSKWEAEDAAVEAAAAGPGPSQPGAAAAEQQLLRASSSGREEPAAAAVGGPGSELGAADEERRRRLREVEVAIMQFKEELEEKGLSKDDVERRAADQRALLLADAERPVSRSSSKSAHREGSSRTDRVRERERRDRKRSRSRSPRSHGKPRSRRS